MNAKRDEMLSAIAREELGIQTLETRRSDRLDFHDLGVSSIRAALARAYEAGRSASGPTRCVCPACGRSIQIRPIT